MIKLTLMLVVAVAGQPTEELKIGTFSEDRQGKPFKTMMQCEAAASRWRAAHSFAAKPVSDGGATITPATNCSHDSV